jgi:hypothetical protein
MPLLSAPSRAPFVVAALFAAGCSAPVVDDVAAATGSTTQGIILVERVTTVEGAPQTHVSAKFMRLPSSADPDLAERVVGSRLDLPAAGECMIVSPLAGGEDTGSALAALGAVELLDVGDLTMKTGDSVTPLAARAFPDAFGLVSGVFYTSRDAAADLPAPARYVLEGSGSTSIERFTIEADAPAAPTDVRVGDAALGEEIVIDGGAVVRWRSDAQSAQAGDLVYVDVTGASGSSLRCVWSDEGRGEVPGSILRSGVLGALPATATLAVHRVRLGAFVGPGIDLGEVRFDLSVVGRATIAE